VVNGGGLRFARDTGFHKEVIRRVLESFEKTGLILVLVFQLAHSVEEAAHPALAPGTRTVPSAWAVHQVETTVDFARENRLLGWYVGGLNFQIEHHLFPRVCHVHYPRIAPIVQAVCAEFGIRYTASKSFFGAVSSHGRWLRRMGRPPAGEPTAQQPDVAGERHVPRL
jgi:linoleoyl-CoA desaturase